MKLGIEITGLDELVQRFGEQVTSQAIQSGLENATSIAADGVKRRTPVQTGFLRSSIQVKMLGQQTARTFAAQQGSKIYYAPFVEKGTGVHGPTGTRITPKSARMLAWKPKTPTGTPVSSSGKIVRPSVTGQEGQKMFEKTVDEDKDRIVEGFKQAFWGALG